MPLSLFKMEVRHAFRFFSLSLSLTLSLYSTDFTIQKALNQLLCFFSSAIYISFNMLFRSIWLAKRSIALLCTCLTHNEYFLTHIKFCLTSIGNDKQCACDSLQWLIKTTVNDSILFITVQPNHIESNIEKKKFLRENDEKKNVHRQMTKKICHYSCSSRRSN